MSHTTAQSSQFTGHKACKQLQGYGIIKHKEMAMEYEKYHICDTVIDNENSMGSRLDVTVEVDSLGAVILSLGTSMTVRTTDQGAMELIDLLENALNKLQEVAQ